MTEIELKLQVPAAALAAVERAVAATAAQRTRLQAVYFDTPDRRLAAAGIALRLRKEGRRWVQTLKAGPAHGMARGEHNVPLIVPAGQVPQEADPARHAGTPPHAALSAALAPRDGEAHAPALVAQYRTDIRRLHRPLRSRHGTVELALDRGEIVACGPDGVERRWAVCELEVELLRGAPQAVVEVARRLALRHGLWLDVRTKAERGDRLARGLSADDPVPAVKAEPLRLRKDTPSGDAWTAVLRNVLAQASPNWSEVAAGRRAAEPVHQLRVALRRLRSAQRYFEGWPGVPTAPAWADAAAALFRELGRTRDVDVLRGGLQREVDAALAAIGEAPLPLPAATDLPHWTDAERARHGAVFFDLLAELSLPAATDAAADNAETGALPTLAAQRLQAWLGQARRDAKRFDTLSDEARHRLRKRLKRLRYAVEFSSGLFPRRAVERYLDALREAQEHLGEFNDVCVALAAYRPLAAQQPQAWFAVGWLAARREATLTACSRALKRLRKARPFWPD
ncbi:CYTH and CHAD domain-containing protein [Methylibium sp.]|uniref:CYTH and CHAD domain-containing protein n=1 Tax=Methylibium sp. TaxID=2067992 RepID=UPI003341831F